MSEKNNNNNISLEISKAELEVKQIELLLKKKELEKPSKRWKLTIELATILVALIAFIGTFLGTFLQGFFGQKQQRREFESNLILNAVETGNSDASKKNLQFLLDVGLIGEKEWKLNLVKIILDTTYKITKRISDKGDVYICSNSNAFAYHYDMTCGFLSRCVDSVLTVSVFEAKSIYRRRPCKYCYN